VQSLHDELTESFNSTKLNVGMDETVDLGKGKSKEECSKIGKGRVFMNYLMSIHQNHQKKKHERGKTMQTQCWADILHHYPSLMKELPKRRERGGQDQEVVEEEEEEEEEEATFVALEWGYDPGHPFVSHCEAFEKENISFYVCPGTSSWATFAGRTQAVIDNCREAGDCAASLEHGIGMLLTDWGDNGHLQPEHVSYIGLVCAAENSWSAGRGGGRGGEGGEGGEDGGSEKEEQASIDDIGVEVRPAATTTAGGTTAGRTVAGGGKKEEKDATTTEKDAWLDMEWEDVRTVLDTSRKHFQNPCGLQCGIRCITCCSSCVPKNRCGRLTFLVPVVPLLILLSPILLLLLLLLGILLLPFGHCRSGTDDDVLQHLQHLQHLQPENDDTTTTTTTTTTTNRGLRKQSSSSLPHDIVTRVRVATAEIEPTHTKTERRVRRSLRTLSNATFHCSLSSPTATPSLHSFAVSSELEVGRLSTLLDLHVYGDMSFQLGTISTTVGNCYRDVGGDYGGALPNGSVVFWGMMLYQSMLDNHLINFFFDLTLGCRPSCAVTVVSKLFGRFIAGLTGVTKERVEGTIQKMNVMKSKITTIEKLNEMERREWYYMIDLILMACCIWLARLQIGVHLPLRHLSHAVRIELSSELGRLIHEHRSLWLVRSRPGGLDESSSFLERVQDELKVGLTEEEIHDWRRKRRVASVAEISPEKKRV